MCEGQEREGGREGGGRKVWFRQRVPRILATMSRPTCSCHVINLLLKMWELAAEYDSENSQA